MIPPKGSVIGLKSRRARLQSWKWPSPLLVHCRFVGERGQVSVWGSTRDLPSTAGVASGSDGSISVSESAAGGRRGEEAHPGLSSSCLCQASSSLSSVQCTLSTAALPRALGAGRCSCLVLGQTRLQVWLNPASPSVLGADRAGAGGRGPGCWGRSGKYRWRPCPHPPDTPEKALVGRGVQFCC